MLFTQCIYTVPLHFPGGRTWLNPRVSAIVGIQSYRVATLKMVSLANAADGPSEKMRWGHTESREGERLLTEAQQALRAQDVP